MPPPDGRHVLQLGFADAHLFDDDAGVFVVDVDHDFFDRLERLAVFAARQHFRARERKLEAFAAHGFHQHAELQFAAAGDFVGVLVCGFGDADGDVGFRFRHQARADDAALHLIAGAAGERESR